jgi:hypothetical protein
MSDELKVGDQVLYVASADHWHELDRSGGDLVFSFVYAKDGPFAPPGATQIRAGDPALGMHRLMSGCKVQPDGTIKLQNDLVVRPVAPKRPWPAVVSEEVIRTPRRVPALVGGEELVVTIHDEERRLVLDVKHPDGVVTMHLPLWGPYAVPHDPAGQLLHSWHRNGEPGIQMSSRGATQ